MKNQENTGNNRENDAQNSTENARQILQRENDAKKAALGARIEVAVDLVGGPGLAAQACGVSVSTLRRYARGEVAAPFVAMVGLARASGVSLEWLATGEGPMRPVEGRCAEPGREDAPPSPGAEQWAYARQKVLTDGLPSEYASIRAVAVFAREALGDAAIRVHGGVFVDLIDAAHQLLQSGADPNLVRRLIATASGHETEST